MEKIICENDNIGYYLNELIFNGYKYIVKAKDNFLSGWGGSARGGHIQLIACKTPEERETILQDLYNDKTMQYVTSLLIEKEYILQLEINLILLEMTGLDVFKEELRWKKNILKIWM